METASYRIFNIYDYPFDDLHFKPLPRKAGENGTTVYADCICAFDIETTRLVEREQSIMYVWQFAIEYDVIMGRTWEEFKMLVALLREKLGDMKLLIFTHNLSYEFVYLSGIYHFNDYEVFAVDTRKVIKCTMRKNLEFRCSYKLTNLSLSAMTKRYNKTFLKQSGEDFDYSKRRFPQTELTEQEIKYCAYDVLGVVESIHAILDLNNEDLYTMPLTSTGFVRKAVKQAMQPEFLHTQDLIPPYRCYQLLKSAFRGGNTHCNRFYTGSIFKDVTSMDISSSYPSQQCNKMFPVAPFKEIHDLSERKLEERLNNGAAVIMLVRLTNVELQDRYYPVPYIPIAKCISISYPDNKGVCKDNGRVLAASEIICAWTDIDYKICRSMYKFDMEILEMFLSWYDYLPYPIRQKNIEYFKNKTELKGVVGEELFYHKNKELL